ncbi:MAG: hypothetical protein MIO92_02615, partial [Methanosarcinaceae archaeon]|nr:hypothetical protein [Methanosarcinaceae archaeon]
AVGIRLDYQRDDELVFNATGEKVEQLLERILLLSQGAPSFRDFTTSVSTLRGKEYKVSIYLEREESNALHWHIDPIMPDKKSELLEIIREFDNSRDYESDELVVFSISNKDVGRLRARIQATRVAFAEYGSPGSKENTLSSGPVTISIYFTR